MFMGMANSDARKLLLRNRETPPLAECVSQIRAEDRACADEDVFKDPSKVAGGANHTEDGELHYVGKPGLATLHGVAKHPLLHRNQPPC